VAIAAGAFHSLALKTDGSVVGWGRNNRGQATAPGGNDFVAIAAGAVHSLALKTDGSVVGWGRNNKGQATAPGGNDFVAIYAGNSHNLALMTDGSVVGWGWDIYGQATPPAGNDFAAIAAGSYHSLALKDDGSVVGWGDSYYGQATPPAGNDFAAIAAGDYYSLALKVEDPVELTSRLAEDVDDLNLQEGTSNSLNAKLTRGWWVKDLFKRSTTRDHVQALTDVNQINNAAAIGALGAFVNEVDAQRGKKITEEDADYLIAQAQHIILLLR
jgi:hypothetical protein